MLDVNGAFVLFFSSVEIELFFNYLAECNTKYKYISVWDVDNHMII